ncbi:hypothetical protein [Actinomycetospora sp. CA-084318]|uniref:hypothetical protein n=1 Tax=Actinomycetospora sp. CA-084318 TaxID=3239892 RepID=UPI003D98F097
MVPLGRGTTPVDAVPLSGTSGAVTALPESLVALGDLPGARHVLVVDAAGDHVRGELGGPADADPAILAWARRIADVSRERGRALEDVVLTTETAHHLVRTVPGVGEDLWVVLRIDREHGNLALARRALAGVGSARTRSLPAVVERRRPSAAPSAPVPPSAASAPSPSVVARPSGPTTGSLPAAMPSSGTPAPLGPAPRRAPDHDLPRPTPRPGSDVPALAFLPTHRPATPASPATPGTPPAAPAVRPALLVPEEVPPPPAAPAPRTSGAVRTSDVGDEPSLPADPETPGADDDGDLHASSGTSAPSTTDTSPTAEPEAAPEPDRSDPEPGMWDPRRRPLTVRQARTWRGAPEVPAAREPAELTVAAPEIPAPRTGSLFAPVVVVPPPPSPVDDDTTEVPAPVPYPIITAPPLEPAPVPAAADPGPAPEEVQAATDAGLPRRSPGANLRSPTPAPDPAPAAALSTGIPGWSTEPSVLRRLLLGLRRLT